MITGLHWQHRSWQHRSRSWKGFDGPLIEVGGCADLWKLGDERNMLSGNFLHLLSKAILHSNGAERLLFLPNCS